jgi:putative membrane protein
MDQTSIIVGSLSVGLPILMLQFAIGLALLAIGIFVYMRITPYDDLALIAEGNTAVGVALGGVIVALALPLYAILGHYQATIDVVTWGVAAVILQLLVITLAVRANHRIGTMIARNNVAAAITLTGVQIAIALINAGLMSAD